nr:MAG TPA: hypothetical protein [Caudoviricetes sp.]
MKSIVFYTTSFIIHIIILLTGDSLAIFIFLNIFLFFYNDFSKHYSHLYYNH